MDVRSTSRREFIRIGFLGTSAALLAACGPQAPAAAPTAAPAAPGQFTNAQPVVQFTPTAAAQAAPGPRTPSQPHRPPPRSRPGTGPAEAAKPAADAKPSIGAVADVKQVPRNRTMVLSFTGTGAAEGRGPTTSSNRYALGANMQNGGLLFYEPVYDYSAFADKWIPWLAEDHTSPRASSK